MSECIACKYSGSDEREYAAHGCPNHTCKKELKPDVFGTTWREEKLDYGYVFTKIPFTEVVLKSDYDELEAQNTKLKIQLENLRKNKS